MAPAEYFLKPLNVEKLSLYAKFSDLDKGVKPTCTYTITQHATESTHRKRSYQATV